MVAVASLTLFLPIARSRANGAAMSLAKTQQSASPKKPARKRSPGKVKFIKHPISGLPVVAARPGQKPITSDEVRALLADFP